MTTTQRGRAGLALAGLVVALATVALGPAPAGAVEVATGADFSAAFVDPAVTGIVLTADIELGCEVRIRAHGAPPIVIEGDDHTVTATCSTDGVAASVVPMTWRDVTILGPEDLGATLLGGGGLVLERVLLIGRSPNPVVSFPDHGSFTLTDSAIEVHEGGLGIDAQAGTFVVERSTIAGEGSGIAYTPQGSTPGSGLVLRDSTIAVTLVGLDASRSGVIERSSVGGDIRSLGFAGNRLVVSDSTLAVGPGVGSSPGVQGGALTIGAGSGVRLEQVTIPAVEGEAVNPSILFAGDGTGTLVLRATVVDAGAGQSACSPGSVTSEGENVVADASCGTGGPDDRVLADPGLEPFDPDTGRADPRPGGPLVDAVEDCTTPSDQLGRSRPQGAACDVGAVELAADVVPPSTSTPTTGPGGSPGPAAPATPVVGPARFTG